MAITDFLPEAVHLEPIAPVVSPDAHLTGASRLESRALALRSAALAMDPVLAVSYRRRASELELELWIRALRSGSASNGPGRPRGETAGWHSPMS